MSTSPECPTDGARPQWRKRQRELIEAIGGRGLSYRAAGQELGLSERTVELYAAEIRALAGLPQAPRTALFLLYRDLIAEEQNVGRTQGPQKGIRTG